MSFLPFPSVSYMIIYDIMKKVRGDYLEYLSFFKFST